MKGLPYLLEALNQIENPEKYLLLIAGASCNIDELKDKFETVEFGYINNNKKLSEIYAMADVFVVPSLVENFPCVILESMASGTPVIAFATGGIPEQIDEDSGWLVEAGNVKALKENIVRACSDREKLEAKAFHARSKAENLFPENRMIERYIEIYNEIITSVF